MRRYASDWGIKTLGYEPIEDAPGQFAAALHDAIASIRATASSGSTAAAR